jgi:hypothetical protein
LKFTRRHIILACCLAIAVAGVAVGILQLTTPAEGKDKMREKVTLKFEARVQAGRLDISYRIGNVSDQTIYTTDMGILVQPGGNSVVGFQPRISWEAPDTILLSTALQPLDPTVARAVPPRVYARRLSPKESVESKVQLALPLRPTGVMPTDKDEKVVGSGIRLEISAIPDSGALAAKEQSVGGQPMWVLSAAAWHQQWIVAAEQTGLSTPILLKK